GSVYNLINGIDADFPPFTYIDNNDNSLGFDIDCVDWIAKEMGFEVTHIPISWDKIIAELLAGKIDLIASGMTITEERKKVVDFTIPYWQTDQGETYGYAVRKEDQELKETLNEGLRRLMNSPKWDEFVTKWEELPE
ncbi:MAG: transporter substrate-binding domain-containing protein, partial [Acidobacteriota bacterium]|nr:transporter substrate-binding domain-containing protein [Acidobacteriota bacterium]